MHYWAQKTRNPGMIMVKKFNYEEGSIKFEDLLNIQN